MAATRPPTIETFAGLYFARVLFGILVALALQRALIAIGNTGEFRSAELKIAVTEVLRQTYEKYPCFEPTASDCKDPSRITLPPALQEMTATYKSIAAAIAALPPIAARPVVATKESLASLHDVDTKAMATKLGLTVTSNEQIAEIKKKVLEKVEALDLEHKPAQYQIQDQVRKLLEEERQRRVCAAILLVLFLVIQPWHLFKALSDIEALGSGQIREGLYRPQTPYFISLLALATIVGVTLTYSGIFWGEAYSGSVLQGLLLFLGFWGAFDALCVSDDCYQEVRRECQRSGRLSPKLFCASLRKGLWAAVKKKWFWIACDIAFLFVCYLLWNSQVEKETTYAQLKDLRVKETYVLLSLAVVNICMFVKDARDEYPLRQVADPYISSLERFSVLSEEDVTDSEFVTESIQSTTDGVTWLDIGSGNLDKVVRVAQSLKSKSINIQSIDCIEPHALWHRYETSHSGLPMIVRCVAWPEFINQQGKGKQWSVITAIHSLYQLPLKDGLVDQLEDIPRCLSRPGKFIVVIEGPTSALLSAKRAVYADIGGTLVTEKSICDTAKSLGWPEPMRKELSQRFFTDARGLSHPHEPSTEFPWFIFESATSTTISAEIHHSVVRRVSALLTECLKETESGRTYLDVGDVALVFRFVDV